MCERVIERLVIGFVAGVTIAVCIVAGCAASNAKTVQRGTGNTSTQDSSVQTARIDQLLASMELSFKLLDELTIQLGVEATAKIAAVQGEFHATVGELRSEIAVLKVSIASGRDTNSTAAFIIAIAAMPLCIIAYLFAHRLGPVRKACDRLKGKPRLTVS